MQSYFVAYTEPRERGLKEANIPFELFQIERQKGLVFEDRHLTSALAAFNSQVETEEASPYEGVRILSLRRGRADSNPAVKVRVEGRARHSGSANLEHAKDIAVEFAPQFGFQEVILYDNNSIDRGISPRTGADKLYIILWSAPHGPIVRGNSANKLWGHRISGERNHWNVWRPSDIGEVIRDNAGTDVAEVIGNNIYVLYPLTAERINTFPLIFRRILEEALLLRGTPEQWIERQQQREAQLLEEARTRPVVVDWWNASREQREKFVAVATEFMPTFGKQIRIHNYCDSAQIHHPTYDGRLHICIWASPANATNGGPMQATLFGAPLTSNERSHCILKPVGEEGQLLVDEDGNHFGEMIEDTIYIHYPLGRTNLRLRWDNKGADALFRRILEEVVFFKTATEEQRSARARALAARHRAQSREEYIRVCNSRFDKALESTRKAVNTGSADIRQLQELLVQKIREVTDLQRKLRQMENCWQNAIETYGKEFDKLFDVPKIRDVRVHNGVIKVFTDTLYCVDIRSNRKHEIGHFRIEFGPKGSVHWYNLARQVKDMQAPHVYQNGEACLGNMAEVIPELAANYEFAALAMVCIQFVESVNVDDEAGRNINLWPVAA